MSFAGAFTPTYGADGAGNVGNYTLGVSAAGADSGVDDVATGNSIFVYLEAGQVVGRVGTSAAVANPLGGIAFVVSVSNVALTAGSVTLDQQRAVVHNPNTGPDQETSLAAANIITLSATVTDRDGDTGTRAINLGDAISFKDDAPSISGDLISATVDEDGLPGAMLDANRTGEVNGGGPASATGSLAGAASFGADGAGGFSLDGSAVSSLTAQNLTSNGVALTYTVSGNTLTAMAGTTEVFTLSLSGTNNSSYTFTLKSHLDHPTLDLVAGDNTENQMSINFGGLVKVTDRDGDSVNLPAGNFSIRVQDDIPVAANITKSIAATVHAVTNLTLILDVSGSMSATVNVGGVSMSRYEAERQAAKTLIDAYEALGDVKVNIVTFSSAATKVGGYWIDSVAAKAAIDALPAAPGGNTNYDAPITMAQLGYNATNMGGLLGNAKDALYFLSDGVPNEPSGSVGMSATEEAAWRTFLQGTNAAGQQITAYALGMGPDVTATALNPIAFDGTGTTGNVGGVVGNTDAIIVSDFGQLTQTLLSTIAIPSVSGNLLTDPNPDVGFGADGGHVQSFTVNGVTYTINSALSSVTTTGTATTGTNTFAFDDANNVITVTVGSATGAKIAIDMDSGAYTYTAAPGQLASKIENIGFTFTDRDGDSSSANLRINVDIPALVVGKNVPCGGSNGNASGGSGYQQCGHYCRCGRQRCADRRRGRFGFGVLQPDYHDRRVRQYR